ncbi:protein phosphatase [Stylonychia lemnae]|uniref:Protein phosphatase n=1 Tax=Stylonychia lemnae TaxID=5949 RepID=A0A078BB57_STYLE|nr:protein phosphatase [Stylonychia lemnae]|eukprot:CDW90803.1 protein phosphatase [Stylonychia lemnae]
MTMLGLLTIRDQSINQCAPSQENQERTRNILTNRVFIMQYPANEPCEDRFNCYQLKNIEGYYSAVFDGHGGWQLSEYAMRQLHIYIDQELKGAKNDSDVKNAIKKAFDKIENDWIAVAKQTFDKGFPQSAYVGSCALVTIVYNNKLYVANAGDSKGVMLRQKEDGSYEAVNLSKTFNANKSYEQERLKEQFKNEKDIVRCKQVEKKACYVKGGLMPTRSFGDLRLKMSEFNFHNYSPDLGYRIPIPQFTGPYVTHEPDIQVYDLTEKDQFIILASDGLWDEISRKRAAVLAKDHDKEMKELTMELLNAALENVSKERSVSREFIAQTPPGKLKRNILDDMTIVVVSLKNQFKQ